MVCCLRHRWGAADAHDSLGRRCREDGEPCGSSEHFLGCPRLHCRFVGCPARVLQYASLDGRRRIIVRYLPRAANRLPQE